jgi:hypothetical protein
MRRKSLVALVTILALLASTSVAVAHGDDQQGPKHSREISSRVQRQLNRVRLATFRFHRVSAAERAGYVEFLECFDDDRGGMGQHYVDVAALDDEVRATHPEAMVYEVRRDGRLRLVAVEYIVPNSPEVAADPPRLFGLQFHLNTTLDVWVLHAWIWKWNPLGMFEDWNPRVRACP